MIVLRRSEGPAPAELGLRGHDVGPTKDWSLWRLKKQHDAGIVGGLTAVTYVVNAAVVSVQARFSQGLERLSARRRLPSHPRLDGAASDSGVAAEGNPDPLKRGLDVGFDWTGRTEHLR